MPQDAPQTQQTGSESTISFLGHSDNVLDLVGRIVNIHEHQQKQALTQLQGVMQLQQSGFPVDPKVFSKLVKKSKLPISTNPEDLKAWMASEVDRKQGNQLGQSGQKPQQGGGPQAPQIPDNAPEYMKNAMGKMQELVQSGKPLDPGDVMKLKFDILAGKALEVENMKAATEKQKMENEQTVESLRAKVGQGDNQALGRLMGMTEHPLGVDQQKWDAMTPVQRSGALDIAAGHESQADFAQRSTRIGESLVTSGRFSDPGVAFKAGEIYAKGGTLPPDLQAKMKPYTFTELADQSNMMQSLVTLGVPPDKIGQVTRAAAAGGLENALPRGLKPLAIQGMDIQREQLDLEKMRYAKELEIAARAAAAEQRRGVTDSQKHDLDAYKALVEIKKAGGKVDDDIIKGASVKAASALGMQVDEVNNLFHFLTGGTHLEFKPNLSNEGKSTVDRFTGKGLKSPEPSTFQKTVDAVMGRKKEPI